MPQVNQDLKLSKSMNWHRLLLIDGSASFEEKDNLTPAQEELIKLRKENQRLAMENDILKQAVLIIGRKEM